MNESCKRAIHDRQRLKKRIRGCRQRLKKRIKRCNANGEMFTGCKKKVAIARRVLQLRKGSREKSCVTK